MPSLRRLVLLLLVLANTTSSLLLGTDCKLMVSPLKLAVLEDVCYCICTKPHRLNYVWFVLFKGTHFGSIQHYMHFVHLVSVKYVLATWTIPKISAVVLLSTSHFVHFTFFSRHAHSALLFLLLFGFNFDNQSMWHLLVRVAVLLLYYRIKVFFSY